MMSSSKLENFNLIFSFQGGKIEANNTSVRESKFGLPLVEETKERMIDLFRK